MTKTQRLQALWAKINGEHFGGKLKALPIRITRSSRTYGYFNSPDPGGRPSIRISWRLARTEPHTLYNTMAHEMIHQALCEAKHPKWDEHGPDFQSHHVRLLGEPYVEP